MFDKPRGYEVRRIGQRGDGAQMTYDEVAKLFGNPKYEKASTWPGQNAQRFFFWVRGRTGHKTKHLAKDDGKARYLWVPIEEVIDHVEPTGHTDSENVYYRLKKPASKSATTP
jgi:hypothetical protein